MSYPVWARCARNHYWFDRLEKVAELFSGNGQTPIWFVGSPPTCDDAHLYDGRYTAPAHWRGLDDALKDLMLKNECALITRLARERGLNILHLPMDVISNGQRCPAKFSQGALGSRNFKPSLEPRWGDTPRDYPCNYNHKNQAYGKILARHIAAHAKLTLNLETTVYASRARTTPAPDIQPVDATSR